MKSKKRSKTKSKPTKVKLVKYSIATIIYDNGYASLGELVEFDGPAKINIKKLLENVVKDYLESPEGMKYNLSINSDFNWGDAFTQIPEKYFRWAGIKNLKTHNSDLTFDHDENLYEKLF